MTKTYAVTWKNGGVVARFTLRIAKAHALRESQKKPGIEVLVRGPSYQEIVSRFLDGAEIG